MDEPKDDGGHPQKRIQAFLYRGCIAPSCAANSKIGLDSNSRNTRSVDRVAASAIVCGLTKLACEFYENRRRNVLQEALER